MCVKGTNRSHASVLQEIQIGRKDYVSTTKNP